MAFDPVSIDGVLYIFLTDNKTEPIKSPTIIFCKKHKGFVADSMVSILEYCIEFFRATKPVRRWERISRHRARRLSSGCAFGAPSGVGSGLLTRSRLLKYQR